MFALQKKVAKFADARKWAETYQVYGIMLNIIEEIGEGWNVIKHLEKDEKLLRRIILRNHAEMEDFIGDLNFLVFKLAHLLKVDAEKAVQDRLLEFAQRFPEDFMKKHSYAGNRYAGGLDLKYQRKKSK